MKSFHEFLENKGLEIKEAKWLAKAIEKPGRCKDMGGPECPKDSPQYKLAKRLKPGGDIYKASHGKKKK